MNETKCEKAPDIHEKLSELAKEIEDLSNVILKLETRLSSVLRSEPECKTKDAGPIRTGCCTISSDLIRYIEIVKEITAKANYIINKLEC